MGTEDIQEIHHPLCGSPRSRELSRGETVIKELLEENVLELKKQQHIFKQKYPLTVGKKH